MALPSLRPRSLSGLLLLGFAVVALPLLLGTVSAAIEMRNLAAASERLVLNGVAATQYTQALVRQVAALERTARLYQILRRPVLLETFEQNRQLFEQTLDGLEALPGDPARAEVIGALRETTASISAGLASQDAGQLNESLRGFTQLSKDAGRLSALASEQTDRELKQLQADTEDARRRLLWQTVALVPVTLGLVFVFTLLLGRPIRQIDAAIGDIGHGRLGNAVAVQGPSDLRALGRQLEWLRQRLTEVAEERNRFLRHMSHELKTPLASIREGTELLLEGAVGSLEPEQREVAGILRENSLQLQRLIENLLSYSEWQAKRGELELGEVNLRQVTSNAIDAYQLPINAHRLRLEQRVDDITLTADRAKLQLVLDNLISNAVKFTPDGGTIYVAARLEGGEEPSPYPLPLARERAREEPTPQVTVPLPLPPERERVGVRASDSPPLPRKRERETEEPTPQVRVPPPLPRERERVGVRAMVVIDVADTGPGIPPEERGKIFEAFYQGATPQGGLVRGTGIGLSVAQEFVQAQGGTIEIVDGEFPGAHFRVCLPVGPR